MSIRGSIERTLGLNTGPDYVARGGGQGKGEMMVGTKEIRRWLRENESGMFLKTKFILFNQTISHG